jgi:hypothetical protein
MLPVLQKLKAPALTNEEVSRAPYFEILLFRTRLRFKDPPRNLEYKVNLYGEKTTDKRPFVNTISKPNYLDLEDALFETLYTTGWKLFPKGWFKPASASLRLCLTAFSPLPSEREIFPDLLQTAHALAWIKRFYHRRYQAYNEMMLLASGEDFELVFNDAAWAKQQAEQREYFIEPIQVNGQPLFKARPEAHAVDFFLAFSPQDILQFSFTLKALHPLSPDEKLHLQQRASTWVDRIMESVELELPSPKLTHLDPAQLR